MKICHISDTHGYAGHSRLEIPKDISVLCHTGDIGGRTNLKELITFLTWFESQPGKKIWTAGNHDHALDPTWADKLKAQGNIYGWSRAIEDHKAAMELISKYDVVYLNNQEYIHNGVKFYGSPYSPSFFPEYWVFNADRGERIQEEWDKIPDDVNILLTHTPVYGIMDEIPLNFKRYPEEDVHVGCKDLLDTIRKRLSKLQLHLSGHIHDGHSGVVVKKINNRPIIFSNGSVLDNDYKQLITKPFVIEI